MPEKEKGGTSGTSRTTPTTPEEYTVLGSSHSVVPSGDYSYTVELVGTIQNALGKLTEAVEALKEQSREQGREIKEINKDIHVAKTTAKIVGAILAVAITFAGWAINKGVDAFVQTSRQPPASQSAPLAE